MKQRFILAAMVAAFPLAVATATPSVHLQVPPPGRWGIEDLWKATVTSDKVCDVWFESWVFEASHGKVFHATTKPFRLARGTRFYHYGDVVIDKSQTAPGYEAFVARQGTLPEGRYSFKLILQPFGVGDSNGFGVKPTGPPRLIAPADGVRLPAQEKCPMFRWTPPTPARPGVRYVLRVVEVLPGQTGKEATGANEPWYEGKELVVQSLRYPVSGRALAAGRQYAWQVRALDSAGRTIAESEVWTFTSGVHAGPVVPAPAPLRVSRGIERSGNFFVVTLTIENRSDADMASVRVSEQTAGLQYVNEFELALGASGAFRAPMSCDVSTARTLTTKGSRFHFDWGTLPRGSQMRLRYQLVPVLYSRGRSFPAVIGERFQVRYRAGAHYYSPSFDHLADTMPADTFDRALQAADYLIATTPDNLFALSPPADRPAVENLLALMAKLATVRSAVLGYLDRGEWCNSVKNLLVRGGAWRSRLGSLDYLLFVGEDNIVPAVDYYTPHRISRSDNWYADTDGNDHVPDIAVGRIVGDDVRALALPIAASIDDASSPSAFDRSDALLVTGGEGQWELFTVYTDSIADILTGQGTRVDSVHHEYYTDEVNLLRSALAILGSAWGVWEHGSAISLPAEIDSLRHLTARWDFYGTSPFTGIDLPEPPTNLATLRSLITVSEATLVERLRRNRPGTYRIYATDALAWNAGEADIMARMDNKDIYYWYGHGSPGAWNICSGGDSFGQGHTFILSESCLTGRYSGIYGAPESCHGVGAAVFVGATEVSYGAHGVQFFRDYWPRHSSRPAGLAFKLQKQDLVRIADDIYAADEYNFYGDPKFGGD
jgi:hypothetical protein